MFLGDLFYQDLRGALNRFRLNGKTRFSVPLLRDMLEMLSRGNVFHWVENYTGHITHRDRRSQWKIILYILLTTTKLYMAITHGIEEACKSSRSSVNKAFPR